jgi:iron(III) transport system ATP-binding protein
MVFQDGALFPHLTVAQNIDFGLRAASRNGRRMSRSARAERIRDTLDLIDLRDLGDRLPDTLSGGQQQRVALARSLAPQPDVLLLDEPFSALDAALRVQVRAQVANILREVGVTAVFVTHDQDEAFVLGDRVAVMSGGRIVQVGSPSELYERPVTPWVAGFVGDANLLDGRSDGTEASTPCGPVRLADSMAGDVAVLARPEELRLTPLDGTPTSGGTVALVEYHGHDTVYFVDLDDGGSVRARESSAPRWAAGDRVVVTHSGRAALAWPRPAR